MDRDYDKETVGKYLSEYWSTGPDLKDTIVLLVETALYIEETFGFVLTDDEICEKNLGTQVNTERFLRKKMNLV